MQSDAKPQGQVRELLVNKALELFTLCDKEDKGFINKRDMQKLQGELPLEPEQLEMVFDSLDVDHNGYLTLEEFTDGFGMFLGFDSKPRRLSCQVDTLAPGTELVPPAQETLAEETADDDDRFEEFLDNLGAQNLFQDSEDYVRDTWSRLQESQDSAMLAHFEQFLTKVMGNIRTSETQCYDLESALLTRRQKQEEQVERLYEEMEQQLRQEKDKLLAEERQKERKLREELEQELKQKDQLLQLLMEKHAQLEAQLRNVNTNEAETKQENAKLLKELNRLEVRLVDSERSMQEMQRQADTMRQHSLEEKRRRAK
ncbi:EF-hand calcium-binding domain-containing protein 4B isoform X1 [Ixodes scapularis]|uniref:EF-hand calcium-binding domain-containing protein 4B isoform X1 n=1 Tax=Ixodes scapularis TaxID=6945 RepID=UPI001C38204D|nr:EF-hand calcium-binding domain-containing protein 4B isoform X1 [Ixodes scapularis]